MEQEYRLWDSQWANIVNHESCYQDYTKEEAVALAVQLTEAALEENYKRGNFPPKRVAIGDKS